VPLEQRQSMVGLEPKRADVIVAGALIVAEVMRWADAPRLLASDRGVRWGLALRLARATAD
jgi:exopolyphosphatase/guanosine-5'-triphosphate,3'-diphosphate pyrophosphatase